MITNKKKAYEITPNCFCKGVERAIKIILTLLNDENSKRPFYMLGHLVHNEDVVSYFEDKITILKNIDYDNIDSYLNNITSGTIIITAHGINPYIINKITSKGLDIVDTTCPNVIKIHNNINKYISEGYEVYIIGNPNHPEVKGYLGISDKVHIYDSNLVNDYISSNNNSKVYITTQTTLIYDEVIKTCKDIKNQFANNISIEKKVCNATELRQKALTNSLNNYDMFIIVGDKLSNNCKSLYEIVKKNGKDVILIKNANDLNDYLELLNKHNSIGVTGGASTPKSILKEVINQINSDTDVYSSKLSKLDFIK